MPVDKASPQARLEEVERGYQDRIARQVKSINRLLEENKLLKIEIATVRGLLLNKENEVNEQNPEFPVTDNPEDEVQDNDAPLEPDVPEVDDDVEDDPEAAESAPDPDKAEG